MEKKKIAQMKASELETLLSKKREELMLLKFKTLNSSLKNVSDINKVKKEIARICTVISNKGA